MALNEDYFRYLDHFGAVLTVARFAGEDERPDAVALRHDVDHDLDFALEMAYWEHRRGVASTYYLLDTAGYWGQPGFVEKCQQLGDFGHEVGLHVNTLAKWAAGSIEDAGEDLGRSIGLLRAAGLDVRTVSAHGDPLCYRDQFINYWMFSELRAADPAAKEVGLNAEGVPADDGRFRIRYPGTHELRRADGAVFPLWSVPMRSAGLAHEAMHLRFDGYFSDSGGSWSRSPDPLTRDLRRGRFQILMHPEHWRGPQRTYIFLSTPRSGSLWLSALLDRATSLRSRHEFVLNHRYEDGRLVAAKRTLEDINGLIARPEQTLDLMLQARAWIQDLERDYAEVNVYLHHFPKLLAKVFPDAALIHLHRDPRSVVRSLMNREWYDTPEDHRHPRLKDGDWGSLGQFQKICRFVARVNETLLGTCSRRLRFEAIAGDPSALASALADLRIPFYPRLAAGLWSKKLNAAVRADFPDARRWDDGLRRIFSDECGEVSRRLGYAGDAGSAAHPAGGIEPARAVPAAEFARRSLLRIDFLSPGRAGLPARAIDVLCALLARAWRLSRRRARQEAVGEFRLARRFPGSIGFTRVWARGCRPAPGPGGLTFHAVGGGHQSVVFGGGHWHQIRPGDGWNARIGHWYQGSADFAFADETPVSLFCLMFDADGKLTDKRHLANFDSSSPARRFSFRTRPAARRFAVALYRSAAGGHSDYRLLRLHLDQMSPRAG